MSPFSKFTIQLNIMFQQNHYSSKKYLIPNFYATTEICLLHRNN
jgi:hypothetical protein